MDVIVLILLSIAVCAPILITLYGLKKDNKKYSTAISFKEGLDLTELPIVTLYHKDLKLHFLLDTGSNISYIDSNILDKLDAKDTNEKSSTVGVEGSGVETHHYEVEISYKDQVFNEVFGAIDLNTAFSAIEEESGIRLHGILGSKFFEKYRYVLDFRELIAYR